jgi:hypothetical protein
MGAEHGVSPADKNANDGWGHRSEMESVDHEKRRSVSQRVNERQAGETVSPHKKDHGKEGHKSDEKTEEDYVESEEKSLAEKYRDKYGSDE